MAILDSGIDGTHADFKKDLESNDEDSRKIRAWKSFPCDFDPLRDPIGHGTHGASVLLRTAPHVALYIARITGEDGQIVPDRSYKSILNVKRLGFGMAEMIRLLNGPLMKTSM